MEMTIQPRGPVGGHSLEGGCMPRLPTLRSFTEAKNRMLRRELPPAEPGSQLAGVGRTLTPAIADPPHVHVDRMTRWDYRVRQCQLAVGLDIGDVAPLHARTHGSPLPPPVLRQPVADDVCGGRHQVAGQAAVERLIVRNHVGKIRSSHDSSLSSSSMFLMIYHVLVPLRLARIFGGQQGGVGVQVSDDVCLGDSRRLLLRHPEQHARGRLRHLVKLANAADIAVDQHQGRSISPAQHLQDQRENYTPGAMGRVKKEKL